MTLVLCLTLIVIFFVLLFKHKKTRTLFYVVVSFSLIVGCSVKSTGEIPSEQDKGQITFIDKLVGALSLYVMDKNKEKYMDTLELTHFEDVSIYHPSSDLLDLDEIKSTLKNTNDICITFFPVVTAPLDPLKVILYDDKDIFLKISGIEFEFDYYETWDDSINMLITNRMIEELTQSLAHEYVHYYFTNVLRNYNIEFSEIPMWFHEGLAEFLTNKNGEYGLSYGTIPLNKLDSSGQWLQVSISSKDPYNHAFTAIDQLLKISGDGVIQKIIQDISNGEDFYTALQNNSGISVEEFDKIIQENIKLDGN